MFLKPASPDVHVPDPSRAGTPLYFLPAEGRSVETSPYWTRRLADGDVIEAESPADASLPPQG